MSRVLVLGAGGMLGHKVCQRLCGHEVWGLVRQDAATTCEAYPGVFDGVTLLGDVDVLQANLLEETIRDLRPQTVVNCVGVVKQREEAQDPYLAVAVNALLPHRLARLCAEIGGRLIHVSTDCVFSGRRGRYRETDVTDAEDLYGKSKALGETGSRETAAVTLRTSFIGRELARPKHGLVEWFLAQEGGSVQGFAGVTYTGLTSIELANVIRRIVESHGELSGLYQVAGEPITKYELLDLLRRTYGVSVDIQRVDEPVSDRGLVMERFSEATGYAAPPWPEMIRAMYQDTTRYSTRSLQEHRL